MSRDRVVLFAGLLSVAHFASAADWTEFRGPTGQGHSTETGLPVEWDETRNVRWRADVAGEGWSSPVIVDDRVFLTTAVPVDGGHERDRSLRTVCLDIQTGRELWNVQVFQQDGRSTDRIHGKNSHASPTPVWDDGRLYVHFGTLGTACLTSVGDVVWSNRELRYRPQHGNGGSPVLAGDLLIVSCDGSDVQYVVALDKNNGSIRWKKDRPSVPNNRKFSFSTPLLITVDGKQQLISPGTDLVVAHDPATGDEIWRVRYDGYSVIPRPVFGSGLVFVSTSYNKPSLLAIRPTGRGDVTDTHVAWTATKAVPHTASMLLIGDELYFVSDRGIASCVDSTTGDVHWQERLNGNFSASPLFADGRIYFQDEDGKTTVVAPGTIFKRLGASEVSGRTLASPAPASGSIFLRTDRHLYRLGMR